ncbi:MAG: GMC family oxidoreductase [Acidobacteria bacterium]|nr:MAG: GMC family oxidoreductase [Acidobacteriota bacterium]
MFIDSRTVERDSVIEADLAIVGSGPAGVSIAKEFLPTGLSVVVIESGGPEYEQEVQDLYKGEESGDLMKEGKSYLLASRRRQFGGTSNHWRGWCRPVDPETFLPRSWVPESGWPLSQEEVWSYNDRASELLLVSNFDYQSREMEQKKKPFLFEEDSAFETAFVHVNITNFADAYGAELEAASNLRVFMHGNLTQILVDPEATRVEGLEVKTLDGNRFRVEAGAYVLAAGAIETPRLLLASNRVQKEGLGNGSDQVGRYYMDHPMVTAGALLAPNRSDHMRAYRKFRLPARKGSLRAFLLLRPEAQERYQLLKSMTVLRPLASDQRPPLPREIARLSYELMQTGAGRPVTEPEKTYVGTVEIASEQVPNPESRITLGDELDPLGMPRVKIDWRLTDQEPASILATADLLAREMGKRLRGRVYLAIGDGPPWDHSRWSNHPMGGTRMNPDPKVGVVDTDCKIHGVDGLYVASSSIFPVAGCSNPTQTIVALAVRLSDHLKGVLRS